MRMLRMAESRRSNEKEINDVSDQLLARLQQSLERLDRATVESVQPTAEAGLQIGIIAMEHSITADLLESTKNICHKIIATGAEHPRSICG